MEIGKGRVKARTRTGTGKDAANLRRAARAGTAGYRAPEVLMQCLDQTTATDVWSAGIILLSLLTRRYPFFPVHDQHDMTALMQIASIVGEPALRQAAEACGECHVCNSRRGCPCHCRSPCAGSRCVDNLGKRLLDFPSQALAWPVVLHELCHSASDDPVLRTCLDFLTRCLDANPHTRITAAEALEHRFLVGRGAGAGAGAEAGARG